MPIVRIDALVREPPAYRQAMAPPPAPQLVPSPPVKLTDVALWADVPPERPAEPTAALPPPEAGAGARWVRFNLYPALTSGAHDDADARLLAVAVPATAVLVLPNDEPDLENAVG